MIQNQIGDDELVLVGHQTNFKVMSAEDANHHYQFTKSLELENSILTPFLL